MSIEEEFQKRLTETMKAKDLKTANIIRMIKTRVMERRTAKNFSGEVDDALYLEVIAAYAKSIEKSRKDFQSAGDKGASALADIDFELAFLKEWLPEQMPEPAVRDAVKTAIAELGATDPKMSGRVVGAVMKKHKGVVSAALVKQIATELLTQ